VEARINTPVLPHSTRLACTAARRKLHLGTLSVWLYAAQRGSR